MGIPYVQMGFRIVLFSIDNSDFLPKIHYICWNSTPQLLSCSKCVSLLSRYVYKYLTVSPCGIWFPLTHGCGTILSSNIYKLLHKFPFQFFKQGFGTAILFGGYLLGSSYLLTCRITSQCDISALNTSAETLHKIYIEM
jgi:hypothetical protein